MKYTISIFLIFCFVGAVGAEPPKRLITYEYTVIDDFRLVSINSHDEKASYTTPDSTGFRSVYTNMKGQRIEFECGLITPASLGDTMPTRINDSGLISGTCVSGDFNTRKEVSFIHDRRGALEIISFPGSDGTEIFALNNKGKGVGQYYMPLDGRSGFFRFHGLIYEKGKLSTFDIHVPEANSVTTLVGVDDAGRIYGVFFTFNQDTNETGPQNWFISDNGQFTWVIRPGAQSTDIQDVNALGQVIGNSSLGPYLLDDGNYYSIQPPAGRRISNVDAIDDAGRIIGTSWLDPCPPFPQSCQPQRFLATPRVGRLVDKR